MNAQAFSSRPKLLLAVDDSIPAQWALQVAMGLGSKLNAEYILVNVIGPAETVGAEAIFAGTQLDQQERVKEESAALLSKTRAAFPPNTPCQTFTRVGEPVAQIIELAREQKASLIVLGSRGRNRFTQFVLGSTAEGVIRQSPCPVLTVAHEPTCC